jgi:hypothetical protein
MLRLTKLAVGTIPVGFCGKNGIADFLHVVLPMRRLFNHISLNGPPFHGVTRIAPCRSLQELDIQDIAPCDRISSAATGVAAPVPWFFSKDSGV